MSTNATIEVVERRCWRHPVTGHTVSIHGAAPQPSEGYQVAVDGYTWRVTNHRGSITYGLGRTVAKTREEADAAAARFAKRTGYRVIPTGVTVSEGTVPAYVIDKIQTEASYRRFMRECFESVAKFLGRMDHDSISSLGDYLGITGYDGRPDMLAAGYGAAEFLVRCTLRWSGDKLGNDALATAEAWIAYAVTRGGGEPVAFGDEEVDWTTWVGAALDLNSKGY